MTYYHILGVPRDAGEETIRSAFRGLVRRYHPDAGEGSSVERFRQVVEAYETLIDPQRRRLYDLSLQRTHTQTKNIPVEPVVMRAEPLRRKAQMRVSVFVEDTRPRAWNYLPIDEEVFRIIDRLFRPLFFRW